MPTHQPCSALAHFIWRKRLPGIFVTGTDTHVGKTFITSQLVQRLQELGVNAVAMKPVACGDCGYDDVKLFWELAKKKVPVSQLNPYHFQLPLAPVAQRSKIKVSPQKIRNLYRKLCAKHDIVLAEGAGGLLVPITWKMSVREIAKAIGAPLLIVARAGLGILNHTILTVEAARRASLKVAAVVLNDWDGTKFRSAPRNKRVLEKLLKVPVFIEPYRDRFGSRVC